MRITKHIACWLKRRHRGRQFWTATDGRISCVCLWCGHCWTVVEAKVT